MGLGLNPVIYLAKKAWEYSRGNRGWVVVYVSMFIIANTIDFLNPLIIAKILNIIQEQGITPGNATTILLWLLLTVGITIGFWMFHGPARILEERNAFFVRANYKKYLLEGMINFPLEWHIEHHSGNTIDKIEKGTNALYAFSEDTYDTISMIMQFVSSYIVLVYFNLHSSYLLLFMILITVPLILKFDKILMPQYRALNKMENTIAEKIFDVISNISTVVILRVEKIVLSSIYQKIMHPFALFRKNIVVNEAKWFMVSLCTSIMTFLVLASYIYFNLKSGTAIAIGTIYILYSYVDRINTQFFRFANRYGRIVRWRANVMNAEELSNEFKPCKKTKQSLLGGRWKELNIVGLCFTYRKQDEAEMHIRDVTIKIKRGEKVAFIGESGSGKTTMLKLIRELYNPKHVILFLDNKHLKCGFSEISYKVGMIPQEPELFATTIRDNITMGAKKSLSYIRKFTDMACFTSVAERLPKKFNSSIMEKGVNLSGGEKQRLALSRALMSCIDKELILLDEPTSSIDLKNELKIYKNIFTGFKKKTIISSIHRLHLLPLFDRIYYFSKGRVIASGRFSELIKSSHEFKDVWEKYNITYHSDAT